MKGGMFLAGWLGIRPALAGSPVPTFNLQSIFGWIIVLILLAICFGGLIFLIRKAPMIPADIKQWIEYALYFIVVVFIIFQILSWL